MRKYLPQFLLLLLAAINGDAQVTLSYTGYPVSVVGIDTVRITTYTSAFPSLTPATGGSWDMSIVTDSVPFFYNYHVPDAMYEYADSNMYSFGSFAYAANAQCSITPIGVVEYGARIPDTNGYSLSSITLGLTDSLIIYPQTIPYSALLTKIALPASYGSKWSSSYVADLGFDLSIAFLSYSHVPGIVRRYIQQWDTVVGWGKMRVKDAVGVPSDSFNVLQVKTIIATQDSFFINGVPASLGALTLLNLNQGQTDTVYEQRYYQVDEITPLTQVTFPDATYSKPLRARTHVKRMIGTTDINNVKGENILIYPNPVIPGGNITIQGLADGVYGYRLINEAGQEIEFGTITVTGGSMQIKISAGISIGNYYLLLSGQGRDIATVPVCITR